MDIDPKKIEKEFYTTYELIEQPWFPVRSALTVKKLIEQGRLSAIDISSNPKFKRYRISKQSVIEFIQKMGNIKYKPS